MTQPISISQVTSQKLRAKEYLDQFPEYYQLETIEENSMWHDHQNVLDHVIGVYEGLEKVLTLDSLPAEQKSFVTQYLAQQISNHNRLDLLKVATLLHDIAKVDTLVIDQNGTARCPGHELIAAGRVKKFADRFNLDTEDEKYVERMVRYHGLISEFLNLILANNQREKYLKMYQETVGDIAIELVLLMKADLMGSDLQKDDPQGHQNRMEILDWMLEQFIPN